MSGILQISVQTFLLLIAIDVTTGWNLSALGINETNTPVNHLTLVKNRAYLAIPRKTKSQIVTLVEAPWPENALYFEPRPFPSRNLQAVGDCTSLQSVICSDSDTAGQLYVLDAGYRHCSPKIVTYDGVLHKKITGFTCDLHDVDSSSLNSMLVDNWALGGPKAYIGYSAEEGLIVYSFREHNWWFVKLSPPAELIDFHPQKFLVDPQQLALSKIKPILYFTSDNNDYLFSLNAQTLRTLHTPNKTYFGNLARETATIEAKWEGSKIGMSQGLICDALYGLYYYIPRFYVLVRWDSHFALVAEHHDVMIQSNKTLPRVEQIFLDSQQSVWVLLGLPNSKGNHCIKVQKS